MPYINKGELEILKKEARMIADFINRHHVELVRMFEAAESIEKHVRESKDRLWRIEERLRSLEVAIYGG